MGAGKTIIEEGAQQMPYEAGNSHGSFDIPVIHVLPQKERMRLQVAW